MKLICLALIVVAALAGVGSRVGSTHLAPVTTAAFDTRSEWMSEESFRDCAHRALGSQSVAIHPGLGSCKTARLLGSR